MPSRGEWICIITFFRPHHCSGNSWQMLRRQGRSSATRAGDRWRPGGARCELWTSMAGRRRVRSGVRRAQSARSCHVFTHPHDGPCCHNLLPNTGPKWSSTTPTRVARFGISSTTAPIPQRACRCRTAVAAFLACDTAGTTNPIQMEGLKSLVGISQIVFGSDFPFGPITNTVEGLRNAGLSAAELQAVEHDNPLRALLRKA